MRRMYLADQARRLRGLKTVVATAITRKVEVGRLRPSGHSRRIARWPPAPLGAVRTWARSTTDYEPGWGGDQG